VTEDVAVIGEPVRRRLPWISLSTLEDEVHDAASARAIGAELMAAADELDRITGGLLT
jgi:hypothetical protein